MFGLTLTQLAALLVGAKLSYDLSKIIPAIPVKTFAVAHIHHMIPLYIAGIAAMAKQSKTGLPVASYFYYWLKFMLRRKVYVWRRGQCQ